MTVSNSSPITNELTTAPSPAGSSDLKLGRQLLFLVLGVTCLAYLATLRFSFVFDDPLQIVRNPTLTSWRFLPTLFVGHVWKFALPDFAGNYYRPLFMSWLLLNRMLWGLNPAPWHASALALHLLATYMAFVVAGQITGNGLQAGMAALLFGLHPIHIESVAWVSGATDPLMAIFVFAALWAWIRGKSSPSHVAAWRFLSAVLYLLGCLSKETAFVLPVLVIAYDHFFGEKRSLPRSIMRAWPLSIAAAVYLVARILVLRGFEHPIGLPVSHILLSVPTVLWGYVRLLVWPVGLSVFYATPPVTSVHQWQFWFLLLLGIVALVGAWWVGRRSGIFAFSVIWILAFLAPAILGLPLFELGDWLHDRYLYVPSFGLCLLIGHTLPIGWKCKAPLLKSISIALSVLIPVGMCLATSWQEQPWANELLLFTHSASQQPTSALAKGYLAAELRRRGDREAAAQEFEAALKLDPNNWKNLADYAMLLYHQGNFQRSDEFFTRALAIDSHDATTHYNQGLSRFKYDNYAGAEASFREALRRNPNQPKAHYWLGRSLELEGNVDAAQAEYRSEIQLHPDAAVDAQQRLQLLSGQ